jgi:hypothetical protein
MHLGTLAQGLDPGLARLSRHVRDDNSLPRRDLRLTGRQALPGQYHQAPSGAPWLSRAERPRALRRALKARAIAASGLTSAWVRLADDQDRPVGQVNDFVRGTADDQPGQVAAAT